MAAAADIARIVRSVEIPCVSPPVGGTCLWRAVVGKLLLDELGIESRIAAGGLIYRFGRDPERDIIRFSDSTGHGAMRNGRLAGHLWLEAGDDLIDFACGDWPELTRRSGAYGDDDPGTREWAVAAPEYIWGPRASLLPPTPLRRPAIGEIWYTDWRGSLAPIEQLVSAVAADIDCAAMAERLRRYGGLYSLKERMAAD